MSARSDEGDEGRLESRIGEVGSGDVAFEVVHGYERKPSGVGETFGGRDADEEGPDQTRTHRDGHAGYVFEEHARVHERLPYDTVEAFEVRAGGDLGNDAAVAGMLGLRMDDVRAGLAAVRLDDGGAGVVTGGFDG